MIIINGKNTKVTQLRVAVVLNPDTRKQIEMNQALREWYVKYIHTHTHTHTLKGMFNASNTDKHRKRSNTSDFLQYQ